MLSNNKLSFITNNVKGIQSLKKRLKLIQYFKSKIGPCGLLFLQETHSNSKVEQKWKEDFHSKVFFSHGKTNSRGVLIAYIGTEKFTVKKQQTDHSGRILILDVSINDSEYILINLYNANTEKEQIEVLSNLFALLKTFDINPNKHIIMAGDFNLFFNSNLDTAGGNPTLKRKSLAKFIELKEAYDLCDIWRVRNAKVKQFTFTQQHSSGFIQRRLDYFFILNGLQEFASTADILAPISTDHSPVLFSLSKEKGTITSKGFWKYNSSLIKDQNYVNEIKDLIRNFNTKNDCDFSRQLKWEILKYKIRKFTIHYTKGLAEERKQKF